MTHYTEWMNIVGFALDGIGVVVIVIGAGFSTFRYLFGRKAGPLPPFKLYRQGLGNTDASKADW